MKRLSEIRAKEIAPGFSGKMVHGEMSTMAFFSITKGSVLPEHQHVNEQITHILEGELEMMIGGERILLIPGSVQVIPSGTVHSAIARTDCKAIDSFAPARDDYR